MFITNGNCGTADPFLVFGRSKFLVGSGDFSATLNNNASLAGTYSICVCSASCVDASSTAINSAFTKEGDLTIISPNHFYVQTCVLGSVCQVVISSANGGVPLTIDDRVAIKNTCGALGTAYTGLTAINPTISGTNFIYSWPALTSVPTAQVEARICWCTGVNCEPSSEIGIAFLHARARPSAPTVTNTTAGRIATEWLSILPQLNAVSSSNARCIDSTVTKWRLATYRVTTTTTRPVFNALAYPNNTMKAASTRWKIYFNEATYVEYLLVYRLTASFLLNEDIPVAPSNDVRRLDVAGEEEFEEEEEEVVYVSKKTFERMAPHEVFDFGESPFDAPVNDRSMLFANADEVDALGNLDPVGEASSEERSGAEYLSANGHEVLVMRRVKGEWFFLKESDTRLPIYSHNGFDWFYFHPYNQRTPVRISFEESKIMPGDELHAKYLSRVEETNRRRLQTTVESLRMVPRDGTLANIDTSTYDASTMATPSDYFAVKSKPIALFEVTSDPQAITQTFNITGLLPFQNYYSIVQAVTAEGFSLWSAHSDIFYVPLPCGNAAVDMFEYCDDGNTRDGDGCSSSCQIETGYRCEYSDDLQRSYCMLVGYDYVAIVMYVIIIITLVLCIVTCLGTVLKTASDKTGAMYACLRYEMNVSTFSHTAAAAVKGKGKKAVNAAGEDANDAIEDDVFTEKGKKSMTARKSTKFEGNENIYAILPQILRFLSFALTTFIVTCQHVSILPLILPSEAMSTVKFLAYSMRWTNFQFNWWLWGDKYKTPTKYGAHKDRFASDTTDGSMQMIFEEANAVLWGFTSYFMANVFYMVVITVIVASVVLICRPAQKKAESGSNDVKGLASGVNRARRSMVDPTDVFNRRSIAVNGKNTFLDLSFFSRFAVVFNEWALMGYFTRLGYIFFFPICITCLLQLASVPVADTSRFFFTLNILFSQFFLLALLLLPIIIIVRVRAAVQGGIAFTVGAVENALGTTFSVYRNEYLDWLWRPVVMRLVLVFTAVYLSTVPWFSALIAAIATICYLVFFIKCQPYRSLYMQIFEIFDWTAFTVMFIMAWAASVFGFTTSIDFPVAVIASILVFLKFLLVVLGSILWAAVMFLRPHVFLKVFAWSKPWIDDEDFVSLSISKLIKKVLKEGDENTLKNKDAEGDEALLAKNMQNMEGNFVKIWVVDPDGGNGHFEFVKMSDIKQQDGKSPKGLNKRKAKYEADNEDDDDDENDVTDSESESARSNKKKKKGSMLSKESSDRAAPAPGQIGKLTSLPLSASDPRSLGALWSHTALAPPPTPPHVSASVANEDGGRSLLPSSPLPVPISSSTPIVTGSPAAGFGGVTRKGFAGVSSVLPVAAAAVVNPFDDDQAWGQVAQTSPSKVDGSQHFENGNFKYDDDNNNNNYDTNDVDGQYYYDENGNYIGGDEQQNDTQGYYDENGNYVFYDNEGYYDENGNPIYDYNDGTDAQYAGGYYDENGQWIASSSAEYSMQPPFPTQQEQR